MYEKSQYSTVRAYLHFEYYKSFMGAIYNRITHEYKECARYKPNGNVRIRWFLFALVDSIII